LSHAAAVLRELGALAQALRQPLALPPVSACADLADRLAAPSAAPARLPEQRLEVLRQELRRVCAGAGASALPPRLLRRAPLVFWHGAPPAATFPDLLDTFVAAAARRPLWLRDLIEVWLRDFDPARHRVPDVGRAIASLLRHAEHPQLRRWHEAHQRYAIFDAVDGPRRLARELLGGPEAREDVLKRVGMDDPQRADGGFFRSTLRALLADLPHGLRNDAGAAVWARARELLEVETEARDLSGRIVRKKALRFVEMRTEVALACLAPWLSPPPGAAPREEIKGFLVRTLGDPRIERTNWETDREDAKKDLDRAKHLVLSWLAEESLEAFLALISQTNDDKQWRYRQAFWRACFRKVPGAQVWVVLGGALARRAEVNRHLHGAFGRMEGSRCDHQAVLLMRLGHLVLSEWTNDGPVRAWDETDQRCPRLYRRDRYQAADLRAPSLDFPDHPERGIGGATSGRGLWHRNGEDGLWQGCAAVLLHHRLGVPLTKRDYMP
jgi:hypothetical protein